MKISINIFFVIYSIIFMSSCRTENAQNRNTLDDMFPDEIELKGKQISLTNEKLLTIHPSIFLDSFMLLQLDRNDFLLRIYDLHNGKYVKDCIKRGRGPNEFVMGYLQKDAVNKGLYLYTPVRRKLYHFNFDSLIKNDSYIPHEVWDFNYEDFTAYKILAINDSLYAGSGFFGQNRFALIDKNRVIQTFGTYPEDGIHASYSGKSAAYQSILRLKPDQSQFISYYPMAGILEIYKIFDDRIQVNKKLHFHYPKYHIIDGGPGRGSGAAFANDSKYGFTDIAVTDSYIFALYSGRTTKEFDYTHARYSNDIYIFNWQGEGIRHYSFPRDMIRLGVNEKSDSIYLYTLAVNPHPQLYKFRLKL